MGFTEQQAKDVLEKNNEDVEKIYKLFSRRIYIN